MAKILCIEDEDDLRQDIVDELTEAGYDVIAADNGVDGLESIIADNPDLVLCDITMPRMDGHTLLSELRENYPSCADLPFVFLSALADRTDVIAGKQLGADDYLTKPIDFELLLATIDSRLRQVGRMNERKEEQMVKLFKALAAATPPTGGNDD
jgi:DNA-binding response OmpR family regulator